MPTPPEMFRPFTRNILILLFGLIAMANSQCSGEAAHHLRFARVLVDCINKGKTQLNVHLRNKFNFLECSWNPEYFGSLAKYVKPEGLHVNFAIDPKFTRFHEHIKI